MRLMFPCAAWNESQSVTSSVTGASVWFMSVWSARSIPIVMTPSITRNPPRQRTAAVASDESIGRKALIRTEIRARDVRASAIFARCPARRANWSSSPPKDLIVSMMFNPPRAVPANFPISPATRSLRSERFLFTEASMSAQKTAVPIATAAS